MHERVRQLGGDLEIRSNAPGTRVIAVLPFAARNEEDAN
jgi:signal transduction histidine kinase